jgi:hypothetical protein
MGNHSVSGAVVPIMAVRASNDRRRRMSVTRPSEYHVNMMVTFGLDD